AFDNAGNENTDYVSFTIDATDPTIAITSPDNDETFDVFDVTIHWTGSDGMTGVDHYEVSVDGGTWVDVGMNTSHDFQDLAEGTHTVDVKAVDGVSNEDVDSVTFTMEPATAPPDNDGDGIPDVDDIDDDNDKISDKVEGYWGTDPFLKDTDNDGYADNEDYYPLDPNRHSAPTEFPWSLLLVPILVFIVILILFLLFRRRKQETELPPMPPLTPWTGVPPSPPPQ
ncbi:MAG: hypothetical protein KAI64_04570, partial [Thermoplasmata archaeon]|nr:hypothetical protein [Thermoplasmata archaeon]